MLTNFQLASLKAYIDAFIELEAFSNHGEYAYLKIFRYCKSLGIEEEEIPLVVAEILGEEDIDTIFSAFKMYV